MCERLFDIEVSFVEKSRLQSASAFSLSLPRDASLFPNTHPCYQCVCASLRFMELLVDRVSPLGNSGYKIS